MRILRILPPKSDRRFLYSLLRLLSKFLLKRSITLPLTLHYHEVLCPNVNVVQKHNRQTDDFQKCYKKLNPIFLMGDIYRTTNYSFVTRKAPNNRVLDSVSVSCQQRRTASVHWTPGLCHNHVLTATALKTWRSTWSSRTQHTTRLGGRRAWPNLQFYTDPSRLWSFLKKIRAVTRPLPQTGNETETDRERVRERERECLNYTHGVHS